MHNPTRQAVEDILDSLDLPQSSEYQYLVTAVHDLLFSYVVRNEATELTVAKSVPNDGTSGSTALEPIGQDPVSAASTTEQRITEAPTRTKGGADAGSKHSNVAPAPPVAAAAPTNLATVGSYPQRHYGATTIDPGTPAPKVVAIVSDDEEEDSDKDGEAEKENVLYYISNSRKVFDTRRQPPFQCYNCSKFHWRFHCPWAVGSESDFVLRSTQVARNGHIIPVGDGFVRGISMVRRNLGIQHVIIANRGSPLILDEW